MSCSLRQDVMGVLMDHSLKGSEKQVFLYLMINPQVDLENDRIKKIISHIIGLSIPTVSSALKRLKRGGWLSSIKR